MPYQARTAIGITLDESARLLGVEGFHTCANTHELAIKNRAMVRHEIDNLLAMKIVLASMIDRCENDDCIGGYFIIQALIGD